MDIRQSAIQTWNRCPEQFRQQYILGNRGRQSAAASFGTVIHYALQVYHANDKDVDLAKETFSYYWQNPEALHCVPEYYLPRTSWSSYNSLGYELLNTYHENERWNPTELIGLELSFKVPVGKHTLFGTIDMLRIRTDKKGREVLDVADFKSASKKPFYLRYHVQFTSYILATLKDEFWEQIPDGDQWALRTFGLPRVGTWIHLRTGEEIDAGERSEGDFHRLEKTIDAFARSIEQNIYVPTLDGSACSFCDFWKECGLPDGNLVSVKDAEQAMAAGPDKHLDW